jgi:hypothetical protein
MIVQKINIESYQPTWTIGCEILVKSKPYLVAGNFRVDKRPHMFSYIANGDQQKRYSRFFPEVRLFE